MVRDLDLLQKHASIRCLHLATSVIDERTTRSSSDRMLETIGPLALCISSYSSSLRLEVDHSDHLDSKRPQTKTPEAQDQSRIYTYSYSF